MKSITLIFSLLFFSINLIAQEYKESELPAAVLSSFKDKYTSEGKASWFKEDGIFSVSFKSEGKNVKADFSDEGKWIDTKYEIASKELPEQILTYINLNFKDAKIKESSLRETSEGSDHYYVVLKKEGITNIAELFFDMKGILTKQNVPDDFISSSGTDQNTNTVTVPPEVTAAFKVKLPDAVISTWKSSDNKYTAYFTDDEINGHAEFDADGTWHSTKYTIPSKELPSPVMTDIKSNYAGYKIKISEMVEEPATAVYYYVFVKKEGINQPSVELYYSLSGVLTKKVSSVDKNQDEEIEVNETNSTSNENNEETVNSNEIISAKELPSPVSSYIKENYQGFTIKEAVISTSDNETIYTVKIKKEGQKKIKELTFDVSGKFLEEIGKEEEE